MTCGNQDNTCAVSTNINSVDARLEGSMLNIINPNECVGSAQVMNSGNASLQTALQKNKCFHVSLPWVNLICFD